MPRAGTQRQRQPPWGPQRASQPLGNDQSINHDTPSIPLDLMACNEHCRRTRSVIPSANMAPTNYVSRPHPRYVPSERDEVPSSLSAPAAICSAIAREQLVRADCSFGLIATASWAAAADPDGVRRLVSRAGLRMRRGSRRDQLYRCVLVPNVGLERQPGLPRRCWLWTGLMGLI